MNIKEQLIAKQKEWFKKTNVIDYDEVNGIKCRDKQIEEVRGGGTKEVYVVSFRTKDYVEYDEQGAISMFTEGMYCWAYYDAASLELLYILKPHGYIEPDGSY